MIRLGFCIGVFAAWISAAPSFAEDVPPPANAAPLANAVRLTPVPELSLMIPHGWIACDPAINEQLGGSSLPTTMQARLCDPGQPAHVISKLVDPNLAEFVMLMVMELPPDGTQIFSRMASETGDALERDLRPLCDKILSNSPGSTCTANVGTVAGRQAVIGQIVHAAQAGKIGLSGKFVVLATSSHFYALLFATLETAKSNSGTTVDAIIDSIEVQ